MCIVVFIVYLFVTDKKDCVTIILEYKGWQICAQRNTSGTVDWSLSLNLKFLNIWKENMGDAKATSVSGLVLNNKCYNRPNVFLRNLKTSSNPSQFMIRKRREIFVAY
jgi:hypothetical protein